MPTPFIPTDSGVSVSKTLRTFASACSLLRIISETKFTFNDDDLLLAKVAGTKASAEGTRLDAKTRDREQANGIIFTVMVARISFSFKEKRKEFVRKARVEEEMRTKLRIRSISVQ